MRLELSQKIIDRLLEMPESGMGYQLVDLVLRDGGIIPNVMVFNSEIANLPDATRGVTASDIADVRMSVAEAK
jgi:hypothetical protein